LRNICEVKPAVFSVRDDGWCDWVLKMRYQRWMNCVLGLPEDAEVPEYMPEDYIGTKFVDYAHGEITVRPEDEEGEGIFQITKRAGRGIR
jgi:hypothetical protein